MAFAVLGSNSTHDLAGLGKSNVADSLQQMEMDSTVCERQHQRMADRAEQWIKQLAGGRTDSIQVEAKLVHHRMAGPHAEITTHNQSVGKVVVTVLQTSALQPCMANSGMLHCCQALVIVGVTVVPKAKNLLNMQTVSHSHR